MIEITFQVGEEGDPPPGDEWLSQDELEVLAALKAPLRRRDWLLGRWLGKLAVLNHLGAAAGELKPEDLTIRAAADGAPEVFQGDKKVSVVLSLSHRGGGGVCAAAEEGVDLGCDLELIEPRSDAFVQDYFTADEAVWVRGLSASMRKLAATLVWSAKESALKGLRQGLRRDTRSVAVDPRRLALGRGWQPLAVRDTTSARCFSGWWCREGRRLFTVVSDPPCQRPTT